MRIGHAGFCTVTYQSTPSQLLVGVETIDLLETHHPRGHPCVTRSTRRSPWHALSIEEKQERLAELRRRQQAQIEIEVRRLRVAR